VVDRGWVSAFHVLASGWEFGEKSGLETSPFPGSDEKMASIASVLNLGADFIIGGEQSGIRWLLGSTTSFWPMLANEVELGIAVRRGPKPSLRAIESSTVVFPDDTGTVPERHLHFSTIDPFPTAPLVTDGPHPVLGC
jgi:hypothetical protein